MTTTDTVTQREFLTVGQACAQLQISRPTLYKLFHDRTLTPVKIGASTRIRQSEIDKKIR